MHAPHEHLHHARWEIRLQWIAIVCMAVGLITSIYYHADMLHARRVESELTSYLHLNDRYHQLLFTLLQNDPDVFRKHDDASLQKNKYVIYELIELFATVDALGPYFTKIDKNLWPFWNRRMEFLFSQPAVQYAWHSCSNYADKIYKPEFITYVEHTMVSNTRSETPLKTVTYGRLQKEVK